MNKYLIDINIISYLADAESLFHENVRTRFRSLAKDDEAFLSIISLYEFYYSLSRANDAIEPKILETKAKVFATLPIIPLSDARGKTVRGTQDDLPKQIRFVENSFGA